MKQNQNKLTSASSGFTPSGWRGFDKWVVGKGSWRAVLVVALVVEGAGGVVWGVIVLVGVGGVGLTGRRVGGRGGTRGGGRSTFSLLGRLGVQHGLDVTRRRLVRVDEHPHGGGVDDDVVVVVIARGGGGGERVAGGGSGHTVRVGGGVLGRCGREAEHGVRHWG